MNKRAIYKHFRQQLSKLPKKYRQEALDEFNRQVKSGYMAGGWLPYISHEGYNCAYERCLWFSFSWDKSKKGYWYWHDINYTVFGD